MTETQTFISDCREAFGEKAPLPILFYYSDTPAATPEKSNGCMFKLLARAKEGLNVTLDGEHLTCGGGKLYTGFAPQPEYVPAFVSEKEHYKATPQDVTACIAQLDIRPAEKSFLNFVRIDKAETFGNMEGMLFFATPDMLSGLAAWAFFDNNAEDAVSAPFGAGCTSIVSVAVRENRINGKRTFIGLLDPSARLYLDRNELSFVIPACRFRTMKETLRRSCLSGTPAWSRIKARINGQ